MELPSAWRYHPELLQFGGQLLECACIGNPLQTQEFSIAPCLLLTSCLVLSPLPLCFVQYSPEAVVMSMEGFHYFPMAKRPVLGLLSLCGIGF